MATSKSSETTTSKIDLKGVLDNLITLEKQINYVRVQLKGVLTPRLRIKPIVGTKNGLAGLISVEVVGDYFPKTSIKLTCYSYTNYDEDAVYQKVEKIGTSQTKCDLPFGSFSHTISIVPPKKGYIKIEVRAFYNKEVIMSPIVNVPRK